MFVVIAALLVSAQAADQQVAAPAGQSPTTVPAAKPAKQKLICKADDADSGTRMAKRICRTADEWNRLPQLGASRSGFSISGEAMQSH